MSNGNGGEVLLNDERIKLNDVHEELGLIPEGHRVIVGLGPKIAKGTQYVFVRAMSSSDDVRTVVRRLRKSIKAAFPGKPILPLEFEFSYQQIDQNSTRTNVVATVTVLDGTEKSLLKI